VAWARKLPSGRWQGYYRDKTGKVHSVGGEERKTYRNQKDARNAAADQEGKVPRGEWVDPSRQIATVAERSATWLPTKSRLRPSSLARLEGVLRVHVLPRFGDYPLNRVSHADVQQWVMSLPAPTAHKAHDALAQIMRAAIANREITFNPCQDIELTHEESSEQRFLSRDEVALLADSIEPRFRALVLLAAFGGLRFGELAGLRRKRIDVLRGRVTVAETLSDVGGVLSFGPPKTKRSRREVPLPRSIMRELETHLERYVEPEADALVFTGPKGAPLRRAGFRRCWWQPATAAAGLGGLKVHELRHSFVTLWRDAGADILDVSRRAGHSSVAFTLDRYGHLYQDRPDDLAEKLDELLRLRTHKGRNG